VAIDEFEVGDIVTADTLNESYPLGTIARGRRTTATGTVTTTETGVVRLDSVPLIGGHAYEFALSDVNVDTSVANDVAAVRFRIDVTGASATIASTQIQQLRQTIDNATDSNVLPGQAFYHPASDETLSLLISLIRVSGTGNVIVFCSSTDILDLHIIDHGVAPSDTGVVI
jgi:hypothetical protein